MLEGDSEAVAARRFELLIRLLRDPTAPLADRDDAAMDLGEFDGDEVEAALIEFATASGAPEKRQGRPGGSQMVSRVAIPARSTAINNRRRTTLCTPAAVTRTRGLRSKRRSAPRLAALREYGARAARGQVARGVLTSG
jgi:hypothetical protein